MKEINNKESLMENEMRKYNFNQIFKDGKIGKL
jgi:hypothetical protein